MKKLVTILLVLVLAGFAQAAAVSYPPGTVRLDDDFDGGTYGENVDLLGQTAANGANWLSYTWGTTTELPAKVGSAWGHTGKGAGYTGTDTANHANQLQLEGGNFLGDDMKIKFSADMKATTTEAVGAGGGVRFAMGINGGRRLTIAHLIFGDWGGGNMYQGLNMGEMHYEPNKGLDYAKQLGSGWKLTSSGWDTTLWWHVEMTVENAYYGDGGSPSRDAGDEVVTMSYYQIPDPAKPTPTAGYASGSGSYSNVDLGGTWMRPNDIVVAFDDYSEGGANDIFAIDNIKVEIIPEPATMAVLAIGGILALLRRRR